MNQRESQLNQKELNITESIYKNQSECKQQVERANKERDAALLKVDEISNQCAADNKLAYEKKEKADQEYRKARELRQNQEALIEQSAEQKIKNLKSRLRASSDEELSQHKKQLNARYIAHEGYHIVIATISLMVIIYHALWLESFRTDFLNSFVWFWQTIWNLILSGASLIETIWYCFKDFDNLAATILGGILLNGVIAIALFLGGAVGILYLVSKALDWFTPKFVTKRTGYICLGILLGIVIFSDVIKAICSINLVVILFLINILVFAIRYFLKDYKVDS